MNKLVNQFFTGRGDVTVLLMTSQRIVTAVMTSPPSKVPWWLVPDRQSRSQQRNKQIVVWVDIFLEVSALQPLQFGSSSRSWIDYKLQLTNLKIQQIICLLVSSLYLFNFVHNLLTVKHAHCTLKHNYKMLCFLCVNTLQNEKYNI